ncbi:proteasome assembly chaperone 4 [Oryctolagus cuniculus]|uniref:Proteasome assembly chaperone 4 n=1 Tax=Oryctolagus cuniculus TaxID=9986 RepID=G1SZB9_RABIT|nr:proteasome assembly chaperone 4 [Oryctolagus cuniculus]XP_062040041.1 proteasome assembly chaperone 4 isoform X1 [Lepus europaeus]
MEGPPAAAEVSLHNFSARLWEQLVHFHVMRLTDSLFLWVGAAPHLRNLAVAMCSRFDSIPVSTSLLGDASDTTSAGLAQRLARKTNKQVFVSYNLQNTDSNFALLVENRIKEEMDAFPEKF